MQRDINMFRDFETGGDNKEEFDIIRKKNLITKGHPLKNFLIPTKETLSQKRLFKIEYYKCGKKGHIERFYKLNKRLQNSN